jgi:transposase InsO family protein
LANVGYRISDTTVGSILKAHGIEPAPERNERTRWRSFLKAHWDALAAADFTTVEVWTKGGLVTFYLLLVLELKSRRVELAGITPNPDGRWITQIARHLTDPFDGFLRGTSHVIVDRDTKFQPLRDYLAKHTETKAVLLPPWSPNLNAYAERVVRSLKEECLSRMIFFGEESLRRALSNYLEHYHRERNHQGLGNRLIEPGEEVDEATGTVRCRERLGGLLRYYYRDAA